VQSYTKCWTAGSTEHGVIMTDRELMDKAWDYLASYTVGERPNASEVNDLVFALERRLAQPEQEPVAWMYVNPDGECEQIEYEAPPDDSSVTPLYATPRPWVGLTDEEIDHAAEQSDNYASFIAGALFAQAKLKEKNGG